MAKVKKTREMCYGCRNDFYNYGGATGDCHQCWSFNKAKIIKVIEIGTWERPPYKNKPIKKKLNCYHRTGYCYVKLPDQKTRKRKFTLEHW